MRNQFVDKYNARLTYIKDSIESLYDGVKEIYLKQQDKAIASSIELANIHGNLDPLEDNFFTFDKVAAANGVVYDNDGFSLLYWTKKVPVKTEYLTATEGTFTMSGGAVIPGSNFGSIFDIKEGFWGFSAPTKKDFSFEIELNAPTLCNKFKINSNNEILLSVTAQTENNGELELGEIEGKLHTWSFVPQKVSKFIVKGQSEVVSLEFIECGIASYTTYGELFTKPLVIDNLYEIFLERDEDINQDTSIEYYFIIDGEEYKLDEHLLLNQITQFNNELKQVFSQTGVVDIHPIANIDNYVDESMVVRYGKNKWQDINTEENILVTIPENHLEYSRNKNTVSIAVNPVYSLEDNCIKKVYLGEKTFQANIDYILKIEHIKDASPRIDLLFMSSSDITENDMDNIRAVIVGRTKNKLILEKCYVFLDRDDEIKLNIKNFPSVGIDGWNRLNIRHVVVNNGIVNDDVFTYDISTFGYLDTYEEQSLTNTVESKIITIYGTVGVNIIEVEYTKRIFNEQLKVYEDVPFRGAVIDNILNQIFYAYRYELEQTTENEIVDTTNKFAYSLVQGRSAPNFNNQAVFTLTSHPPLMLCPQVFYKDQTPIQKRKDSFDIDIKYLTLKDFNVISKDIVLKVIFRSKKGSNSPKLRNYKVINKVASHYKVS